MIFSTEHETRIRRSSLVTQELRHAELESELFLEFQPISDVVTRRTIRTRSTRPMAQSAARRSQAGRVHRIAERAEIILRITEVLLHKALAEIRIGQRNSICRSIFPRSIFRRRHARAVLSTLSRQARVPPHRVSFEITETAVTRDFEQARSALTMIKQAGCRVSLDDFGTGYSSLSYVHRLPFDSIKIDPQFHDRRRFE